MGTRIVIALIIAAAAVLVARWLERKRPAPPTQGVYPVPAQLDRTDFPRPEAPWIVVLFSSATCDSCGPMALKVAALETETVATCEVEVSEAKDLHTRYGIEGVPTTVVADHEGVVKAGFVGAVTIEELDAALAAAAG